MTFTPFTPDSDTAQQLAESELSKAMYQHAPNLLERIMDWIVRRLSFVTEFVGGDGGAGNIAVMIGIGLFVTAIIAFAIRHARSSNAPSARIRERLFDDDRTSEELFAAANRAESDGDLNLAVVERFRAIMRLLGERELIHVVPGMTALEASREGATRLGNAQMFVACAQLFNDVYYWHGQATEVDVRKTHDLHRAVAESKVP